MSRLFDTLKRSLPSETDTLESWQERSFFFVLASICLFALPALINSSLRAVNDRLWINLAAYISAYLVCLFITLYRNIPFKARAWTGVLIFFSLGVLSIFSTGPIGSGRIWLFTTAVFATLTLGIRPGIFILAGALASLALYGSIPRFQSAYQAILSNNVSSLWTTTSITFVFLCTVTIIALGGLIRGLSGALEKYRSASTELLATTRELEQRIAAHHESVASLRESEERWSFALEGAGDGVWDWSLPRDHIYLSPQWRHMLGYGEEEVENTTTGWLDLIHPDDRGLARGLFRERMSNVEDLTFQHTYRMRCRDGSYKWILNRGKVMARDDNGNPLRIIGTHSDITQIKELEAKQQEYESRLLQSEKMEAIGTLAGGIAHDFNNILSPIMGHAELTIHQLPPDSPVLSSLEEIYAASRRAKELVKQILTFSRLDQGPDSQSNLGEITKEALKLIRASIPSTVAITHRIEDMRLFVNADPVQIHQIIMNLATNAYQAMEETGGTIDFHLHRQQVDEYNATRLGILQGTYAVLRARDTGPGIPDGIRERIFNPFFTTKQKGRGTGMGLSVVHGIVEGAGGAIRVSCPEEGGTTFTIYIPLLQDDANTLGDETNLRVHGNGERILLIDDEAGVVRAQSRMLEYLGYAVTSSTDSREALVLFQDRPENFDLVITDSAMPNLSGTRLAEEIKHIRSDIPILLCTGFNRLTPNGHSVSPHIDGFLMKPVTLSGISRKVHDLLPTNNN